MTRFSGKSALITGSARGIGKALAVKLAAEGAGVVINDIDGEPVAETVAEIIAMGGKAAACAGDVTDPAFADRFVQTALDHFGDIDIIVNNAGYATHAMIQNATDDQFMGMLDVHLVAPFRVLRAAAPHIRERAKAEAAAGQVKHRKVVNVSSGATRGTAGHSGYAAGKSGLIGLTNVVAREWGRFSVNVNAVAFGLIRTRFNAPLAEGEERILDIKNTKVVMGMSAERFAEVESGNALGRAGTPEEAAGAIYLLCCPESDFITGQTIWVTGG